MKKITCFAVYGHTDTTEGRGPMEIVARFMYAPHAMEYVKSKEYAKWCVMGHQNWEYDKKNIREETLVIFENFEEYAQLSKESLKNIALSKLTKEEKEALGLV